jgi:MATE family multidrug resistance protein
VVTDGMAALGAWYFAETGPAVVVAGMGGFFGGIGRTGLVMRMSLGICLLSIALNYALISGHWGMPALGIHGAGIATLVATVVGALGWLGWFFAPRMRRAFGTWRMRNADGARLARYARYGLPRGGTEVLEMMAMLLFTTGITRLGTEALAASNIALSLYLLVFVPLTGFGQGITIAVGQAVGAGRPDLARAAVRRAMGLVAVVLVAWALACWCMPHLLLSIYVGTGDADPQQWERILALGLPLMTVLAFLGLTDGVHLVYRFAVQGAGDTRWPLVVLTACAVLLLGIPVLTMALLVPADAWPRLGIHPLTLCWLVMVGYTTVIAAFMTWRFHYGPWPTMSIRR